jgi:hypothetical protein
MTSKIVCRTTAQHASLIASVIAEAGDDDCAVTALEEPGGAWVIEAYFSDEPDIAGLQALLHDVTGDAVT